MASQAAGPGTTPSLPPQRAERAALCNLFERLGPKAPTLCEGWKTVDLAAHLVVRERNPLAGPGLVLGGPFAALTARIMARTVARRSYEQLVARVRSGPPPWTAPFDALINLIEYFVHHEDVRRGSGDSTPRQEAEIADIEVALWRAVERGARLMTRSVKGIGLDLVSSTGPAVTARAGSPRATITGRPGEIVLYLSGRRSAAHVELGGAPEAVAVLREARFGL
ncbi:MAG TPA: TIGR03085 family metal-binding protein [Acidimicrobiales bacterium]|nr:TIGR03085 family metal-binding protein [Acidimicrobiales bacterium]